MSAERNKALVRGVIEGFLNPGDPVPAGRLFSPGYMDNNPSNPRVGGLKDVKRSVANWHRAFPGTVKVVGGVPAEVTFSGVFRGEDGKVEESRDHFDALGLLGHPGDAFRPGDPR